MASPLPLPLPTSELIAAGVFLASTTKPRRWLLLRGHRSHE